MVQAAAANQDSHFPSLLLLSECLSVTSINPSPVLQSQGHWSTLNNDWKEPLLSCAIITICFAQVTPR